MTLNIEEEVVAMRRMTAKRLREKYAEVVGEEARSSNKSWLIRRIAWRMQANAEGDLTKRARREAAKLADDADVRVTPPRNYQAPTKPIPAPAVRDERLPTDAIERVYKGQLIRVVVRDNEFEYDGKSYRSLSAVAKAVTGSHCNGYRFFRLGGKS